MPTIESQHFVRTKVECACVCVCSRLAQPACFGFRYSTCAETLNLKLLAHVCMFTHCSFLALGFLERFPCLGRSGSKVYSLAGRK